jgi:hypothetical protein
LLQLFLGRQLWPPREQRSPAWNSGGPWIAPEDAMKDYTWTPVEVESPSHLDLKLPLLPCRDGFARDVFVLAYPTPGTGCF